MPDNISYSISTVPNIHLDNCMPNVKPELNKSKIFAKKISSIPQKYFQPNNNITRCIIVSVMYKNPNNSMNCL